MPEEPSLLEVLKALFQKSPEEHLNELSEELGALVTEAEREGLFTPEEKEIVLSVLRLRRVSVRELMIPRKELVALSVDDPPEKVMKVVSEEPHSYYPVYEGHLDNFLGVVSLKELARQMCKTFDLRKATKSTYVIPETLKVREALQGFRERKTEVALVIDELGVLSGMLRLKDLFEAIFPIRTSEVKPDEEGWFEIPPDTPIEEVERLLGVELPRGNYETLAGLITAELGRIPTSGEKVEVKGLEVEVMKADERAVRALRVRPVTGS